ncbi:hypothetical protein B0H13DRAFT_2335659 [Mycena leptocephala]|nr:hypothetical protein B0H13DRAFT_2335659 [Mycena leptocephala]
MPAFALATGQLVAQIVTVLPLHRLRLNRKRNELKGLGAPSSSCTETLEGGIRGELCFKELAAAVVRITITMILRELHEGGQGCVEEVGNQVDQRRAWGCHGASERPQPIAKIVAVVGHVPHRRLWSVLPG